MNKFHRTAVLLLLSSFAVTLLGLPFAQEWTFPWCCIATVLACISAILCFTSGVACLVISTQRTSKNLSVLAAIHHLIIKYYRLHVGSRMLRQFRLFCENPRDLQEDLLKKIIQNNKNTEYGRQFQLNNITCLEDLRRNHAVTDYSNYETFVDRIANGATNELTTEAVTRLILTSGTTGKGKRIPQNWYSVAKQLILQEALQQEMFPDLNPMQSKLRIHCNGQIHQSECGITIASALTIESHMLRHMVTYSSPPDSFMIDSASDAIYVHLLFAIRDKNLGSIFVSFSSLFLDAMKYLEANWKLIVEDLAHGTLNSKLKLSPRIRSSLTKNLWPNQDIQRANEVRRECEKGFVGILKRLWPHLKFISTVDNVNLRDSLKKSFAKGVEMYSPLYVSSETLMGLNLWPYKQGQEEYALCLADNIFEFIPEDEIEKASPQTCFVDGVEVGQNYELIYTQKYGLYRYRSGDVVKVSGFYKNCPKVKFLYRKATLLNLVGEKVDQTVVSESVKAALNRWSGDVELLHYSVTENTLMNHMRQGETNSGASNMYYVFFLEFKSLGDWYLPVNLQPEIVAQEIDKNIYERHSFFRNFRDTNQISKSKVYFVNPGTFNNKLKEFILGNTSASRNQFKMPLKLMTTQMSEIMLENII